MSLGVLSLACFLAVATWQDVRFHYVERWVFLAFGLQMLVLAWPPSIAGALLGYGLLWCSGAPSGDRLGAMLAGLVLGPVTVAVAVIIGLTVCAIWWSRDSLQRSPADFAFFPFLSIGVGGTVLYRIVEIGLRYT